jgi:phage terminase large subunit GpA-like protein
VLISAIDVQKNAFVCQTVAFGVGGEWWLVDRFKILASKRIDESSGLPLPIDPAGSITDWHEITAKVLDRTYLTHGGNRIKPHLVLCDSGGEQGVTPRAYEFYRRLRAQTDEEGRSYHRRFMLVKGGSSINAPTVKETWPDSTHRKDRRQGGKGDVPVLQLNTTILKDSISADMKAENPGPGYGHIPPWIDPDVFDELLAEVRTPKGWEKIANRNEAFDLVCYCKAGLIHLGLNKWGDGWRMCPYHLDSNHRQKPQPKTPPRRSAPIPTDWSFDRR